MLISYRWLTRHVDLDGLTPQRVAELLTLHTAEVEGVEPFAPALSDVVVGHVLERTPHPDADKLGVCRVDVGEHKGGTEPLQIVCGAPNVAAGQKVAVARIGTVLPGDFKIKKSKIRGVESFGMICSERELGLGDEHDGIWVLDGDAPIEAGVGTPVAEAVDAGDWIIEIDNKSLTHRPDLWGHRGIARELAALTGRTLKALPVDLPAPTGDARVEVRVEHAACSRYLGLPIGGVDASAKAPAWMRMLLLAAGQRPLGLLVDLSNFVMLDLGQPNHLFDRRRLGERAIVVRAAKPGETMTTLDEFERTLTAEDLLICADDEPVALAGVMGGEGSKVADDTDALLLEVACFDPSTVRRTAARVGLRTDSSTRFEKHLDPLLPLEAAGHLVNLLREIQPSAHLAGPLAEAGDWTDPSRTISARPARIRALLGTPVGDDRIAAILESLDLAVTKDGDRWTVAVPARRATKDLSIEEDLVEEVGRVLGYDSIESVPMLAPVEPAPRDRRRDLVRLLEQRLSGAGACHEAMTYSFVEDGLLESLGLDGLSYARAVNPVAEGMARIRRSIVPSLIARLPLNLAQRSSVRLFEIGKGTRPEVGDDRGQPGEVHHLALVLADSGEGGDPLVAAQSVLADALGRCGSGEVRTIAAPAPADGADDTAWAHPVRRMAVTVADRTVGILAAVDPRGARALGIEGQVAAAEIDLDALLELGIEPPVYTPIPRFPGVKVDVALATPDTTPAATVLAMIEKAGKGLVAGAELFDVYRGEGLGEGRKSLAWHVVLQAADRTLEEKDQSKFLDRLERLAAADELELRRG